MGWTYTHKPENVSVKEFFEKEFNHSDGTKSGKVLACAVKNMREAYIAYESKTPEKTDIIAIVCLLDYRPNDSYNFGYKDMEECMGPYYHNCPQSILDMLTPTTDDASNRWRNACREKLAKKSKIKVVAGDVIKFTQPIKFTNGVSNDTFVFVRNSTFQAQLGGLYRISHWKEREFVKLTQ